MKTINIFRILACTAAISLAAACYDDAPVWDELEEVRNEMGELASRIEALEKSVAEDVAALQSMISVGSIASWTYNAETGKGIITLVDGQQITIDQQIKGYSIITVEKGEDGVYYWALCRDGVNLPLTIDNKKVPVTVTPSLKISSDNTWMISVDGGKTWIDTGISYYAENTGDDSGDESEGDIPEVVVFDKVEVDGDYLILTLVGGTELKVAIVGEAIFKASADTLWFSRGGLEKSVAVEMQNVKAYTITEKPEGWKTSFDESYLYVTAPENFIDYPDHGVVKVFVLFDNGAQPDILQLAVQHEPMLSLARANGVVSVKLSDHTAEDFTGYVLAGWPKATYNPDEVVAWLNSESQTLESLSGSQTYNLIDIIPDYDISNEYVVTAAPYLPPRLVANGTMTYSASDLVTIETIAVANGWEVSEVRYDSAYLFAAMTVSEYFGGFEEKEDWDARSKAAILEMLLAGNLTPMTNIIYEGPANAFPEGGEPAVSMNPATEYVIWYIPALESGLYTEDMFVEYVFTTPDIAPDASIPAPSFTTRDLKSSGVTADVTPAGDVYKTYAAVVKAAALPETEAELVKYLINRNQYSEGSSVNTVSNYSLDPEDEVYVVAVSVSADGHYGSTLKEKVALKPLVFTEQLGVTVADVEYDDLGNATLTLEFNGSPVTMTYMAASYTFYTDEMLQSLMAKGQLGDAVTVEISKIGNKITLTGLELGVEHIFYAVVTDSEDNHSYLYCTYAFTPSIQVDYVLKSDPDYEYGRPALSGKLTGSSYPKKYDLTITMPSECVRYWYFYGNSEYFTGDEYSDTDKLISMQLELSGEQMYETSVSLSYDNVYGYTRMYVVWLDDKGKYHTIYEFNPTKR